MKATTKRYGWSIPQTIRYQYFVITALNNLYKQDVKEHLAEIADQLYYEYKLSKDEE